MSKIDDIETSARIKVALIANPNIGGFDIGVDTINGIVWLSGVVQDPAQKDLAGDLALEHGGLDIKNDIQVLSELAQDEAPMVTDFAEEDDSIVRDRVYNALEADNRINIFRLNVRAVGGIVQLTGVQDDEESRARAEQIARSVNGVVEVVNDIEIQGRKAA